MEKIFVPNTPQKENCLKLKEQSSHATSFITEINSKFDSTFTRMWTSREEMRGAVPFINTRIS